MSTGPGGKPDSGSQPGRPDADTPRLVVRARDPRDTLADAGADARLGSHDTAVADPAPAPRSELAGAAELVGATLAGRYLVTRKVGQGGMGAVYEATHTLIGKRVAVKVLLEKYAHREAIVSRL